MATYYVDAGLSTGDNDGSSPANAWQTVSGMNGNYAAGDTILIDKNTEDVLSSAWTPGVDGNASAMVQFVSADKNDSWNPSPGAVINAGSLGAGTHGITMPDYSYLSGVEIKNGRSANCNVSTVNTLIVDCVLRDAGQVNLYGTSGKAILVNCSLIGAGANNANCADCIFDSCYTQTASGSYSMVFTDACVVDECILVESGKPAVRTGIHTAIIHSVFSGNTYGVTILGSTYGLVAKSAFRSSTVASLGGFNNTAVFSFDNVFQGTTKYSGQGINYESGSEVTDTEIVSDAAGGDYTRSYGSGIVNEAEEIVMDSSVGVSAMSAITAGLPYGAAYNFFRRSRNVNT